MSARAALAAILIGGSAWLLWRELSRAPGGPIAQGMGQDWPEMGADPWGGEYTPQDADDAAAVAFADEYQGDAFDLAAAYVLPVVYRAQNTIGATFGGRYMITSLAGIDAIRRHEALRLQPYKDIAGHWTVGYGHKLLPHEPVEPITEAQAIAYLTQDVGIAEDAVNAEVRVPLTQNQFDALVSLVFNIGTGAFRRSTLLKRLNAGDYSGAQAQFLRWNKARINGALQPSQGLTNRRVAEAQLFGGATA